MSKLINEDWEHASRAVDEEFYAQHQQYIMEAEWQEWEYLQSIKNKKPAKIIVNKPTLDENTYNSKDVSNTHQKKL